MAVFIPEPIPDFAFLYAFGSVYFGIVSRRRRPPKSKNPPKKWQHLTGITGSLSSESVAGFASDYPDFLTIKEVRELQCKKISIPPMEFTRDVFVFACYTGLSYSDIEKLNSVHIQKGNDGNDWIIIDRTKTESRCRIPLLPVAQGILNKYENHPLASSSNRLLPMYSNQKMNCYLKELADICGIRKNLTMHVARHTFATSITLSNGVPIETVSKMLGHSSLKTTQIYARIVDSKISEDMKKLNAILNEKREDNVLI